jgi:hypothetical protein
MVHYAGILRRASKDIYHNPAGRSIQEKSNIALELDKVLESWKANLPPWLNLDNASLRETEWASKQKLVLQLRKWKSDIISKVLEFFVSTSDISMSRILLCQDCISSAIPRRLCNTGLLGAIRKHRSLLGRITKNYRIALRVL